MGFFLSGAVMELDTEVKLMPPAAIEAFMVQLGGAIPSIPPSSPT